MGTGTGGADEAVGAKINIPKDYLVKSCTLETCQTADIPVAGYVPGDKYIDFVVNTVDASETATHIYLKVSELVDVYTAGDGLVLSNGEFSVDAGNGLEIDANGKVGVKVDSTNANGLAATSDGIKIAQASSSATGALTNTDWSTFNGKQDALSAGTGIDATSFASGTVAVDGDITAYSGTGAIDVTNHVISVGAATQSAAGTMSAADKAKLDSFEEATSTDIAAIKATIWPSA